MGYIVAVENLNLNASVKYSVHVVSVMEPLVIQKMAAIVFSCLAEVLKFLMVTV